MRPLLLASALMTLFFVAGCAQPHPPVGEAEMTRGHEALAPFQQQLLGALTKALADGGPENAIDVCRVEAPTIAKTAAGDGVEVGRTSHRLRNPANAPRPWMEPLLAAYLADPANAAPRAMRLDDGRIGYVEPIRVKGMCLSCHGESIAAPLLQRIRTQYPQDAATGFREGDFRGMFWAELAP